MTETITFGELCIAFDTRVLRPRPWTAAQSQWAAEMLREAPDGPVLELCCGAGQIGLLAVLQSDRRLVCVDADPVACAYALDNAIHAGRRHLVNVRLGRMEVVLDPDERFAVVIADPPWVRHVETERFPEDPLLAIDGGDDGLDVARSCLAVIAGHLAPGGSAVLQLGTREQAAILADELPDHSGDLRIAEVRELDGGVLLRINRP